MCIRDSNQTAPVQKATWEAVVGAIGVDPLRAIVREVSLIGMVNWSLCGGVESIWEGLCRDVLPDVRWLGSGARRRVFVDLSDPAKRPDEDVRRGLALLRRMNGMMAVTLGLNLSEARRVATVLGQFRGLSETRDAGHVLGARAAVAFLRPTADECGHTRSTADIKRTDALGPVDLVRGQRHQIHIESGGRDLHFSKRLHRIGVYQGALGPRDPNHFVHRLQNTGFVVREHHRDQAGDVAREGLEVVQVHLTLLRYASEVDSVPGAIQGFRTIQHRVMFEGGGDEIGAGRTIVAAGAPSHRSEDRQIVGFRAAAGKDDLAVARADQRSDPGSGFVDGSPGALTQAMNRRRVAEILAQIGQHGL